jgi:hypothetical protein
MRGGSLMVVLKKVWQLLSLPVLEYDHMTASFSHMMIGHYPRACRMWTWLHSS